MSNTDYLFLGENGTVKNPRGRSCGRKGTQYYKTLIAVSFVERHV